jgi:hypothetical protein
MLAEETSATQAATAADSKQNHVVAQVVMTYACKIVSIVGIDFLFQTLGNVFAVLYITVAWSQGQAIR